MKNVEVDGLKGDSSNLELLTRCVFLIIWVIVHIVLWIIVVVSIETTRINTSRYNTSTLIGELSGNPNTNRFQINRTLEVLEHVVQYIGKDHKDLLYDFVL